jgi:triacylglycerol lipase
MTKIPYDASRSSLYKPGEADDFFRDGLDFSNLAVLCAEMARLAYVKDEGRLTDYLVKGGFHFESAIGYDKTGTQAFIAGSEITADRSILLIAFRGTEGDDPSDLLSDADLRKTSWSDYRGSYIGEVHNGFAKALADGNVLSQVTSAIDALETKYALIVFTGHSLGAALATLASAYFQSTHWADKSRLFSFGSPLIGDTEFATKIGAMSHQRFVNCCDLVTRIPPESLGFVHTGKLHYIDRHGKLIESPDSQFISEDRLMAAGEYIKEYAYKIGTVWVRELADHAPINYLSGVSGAR